MVDLDALALGARDVLRAEAPDLLAEACAWSVGLSDQPHWLHRDGHLVPSGSTLGDRAATSQPLTDEGHGRFSLAGAIPGSFADALNALRRAGGVHADLFDEEVIGPFVASVATRTAAQVRDEDPTVWEELVEETGEDDPADVARALDWEPVLRSDAERLVLDALGGAPLVEVEAEGAPLAVVRAAERALREADGPAEPCPAEPDEGVLFLADAAIRATGLETPVRPHDAAALLEALVAEGLEPDEVRDALPHLPVLADTADVVTDLLADYA